jgi:putative FmdB family regulatory protein
MPVYEYVCLKCSKQHEEIRSITDYDENGPRKACPSCKKSALERRVTSTAFVLDGHGWPSKDLKG